MAAREALVPMAPRAATGSWLARVAVTAPRAVMAVMEEQAGPAALAVLVAATQVRGASMQTAALVALAATPAPAAVAGLVPAV